MKRDIDKRLHRRILEISYKHKLSHIGSCLKSVDLIDYIYRTKRSKDLFVLSSGHAGLALYVVLEKYEGKDAEKIFEHHGVHPDRCIECGISVSTGSLGQGLPIALGLAISDPDRDVFCLISDGEIAEGSIYEALNIKHQQKVDNLLIYTNFNGFGAYRDITSLPNIVRRRTRVIDTRSVHNFDFMPRLHAHYHTLSESDYKKALERYED